ncbi:molybdenum cofactor guanylyltransferase [Pseudoclavibacter sp. VKM Ac-2867]|uniref:molybdenum cofactor guanylyltransferase n=1 Tax=Pseudoclavibacter sp. VKM Ac-2867 TaxID=2783829 RepID=UPI00188A6317|nr:NTP transferase domain-containing protein [Pseudoclavibacter sp. VKM Ac-2867]MBF4458981.1 NTP transferase domain-containing protein [Pseudoclavibacter sp. VKM Ac-2867]
MEARAVAPPPRSRRPTPGLDAVILAGGRGSRLGGVSKGDLEVGGRRLIDVALGAAHDAGASRTIVVGAVAVQAPAELIREDPAFGGPAAGLAAALPSVSAPWLLLLACDLPRAPALVELLTEASGRGPAASDGESDSESDIDGDGSPPASAVGAASAYGVPVGGPDGFVVVDSDGRPQWLAGIYRTTALKRALEHAAAASGVHGLALRHVLESLTLTRVPDRRGASADIDTPEQLAAARADAAIGAFDAAGTADSAGSADSVDSVDGAAEHARAAQQTITAHGKAQRP